MNIKIKKAMGIVSCLILTVLLVFFLPCDSQQSQNPKPVLETPPFLNKKTQPTLTIAMSNKLPPFSFLNAQGEPAGLFVDIWRLWSEKTGRDITFRLTSWGETLKGLKQGAVDIHSGLFESESRAAWIEFSQPFYGVGVHAYLPLKKRKISSFQELTGQKVGVTRGGHIENYIRNRYPEVEVVPFRSMEEAIYSAQEGTVAAFIGLAPVTWTILTHLGLQGDFISIPKPLYEKTFHAGVLKKNVELLTLVDKGFDDISISELAKIEFRWIRDRLRQYYKPGKNEVRLTHEERTWLAKNPTVRVCATNHAPLLFYKDNKAVGISADFLNEVSKHTGVKFDIAKPIRDFSSSMQGLIEHKGPDVFAGVNPTPERAKVIVFTKTYWSSPKFIFTRDDAPFVSTMEDLSGKTVAVIKGYLTHKLLAKNYPDINLLTFKNNKDALSAVSSKKALAFIGSLHATSAMINEFGLTNLKASAPSTLPDAVVAMGIRSDWPELRNIMDKVFDAIPGHEKANIVNRWSTVKFEQGIRPADVIKWVMGIGLAALIIILFFVGWNRTLNRRVRERTVTLESEMAERKQAEEKINNYQERLKALASQLTITEEKERRRIAANLHDQIGQSLALARIQMAVAKKSAANDGLAAKLDDVSEILREAVQDTRHLIFDLSPPAMHEIGLGGAISEWIEDQIGNRYGLETEFFDNIDQSYRKTLDENVRAILFRNVRELLINVVKHSQANQVSVSMEVADSILKIVVQDDGIGFDFRSEFQSVKSESGFGLFSIKERMADMGGALEIESETGKGCKAILTVPYSIEDDKETT
ncbi:MAG: transporter substrate-binding domain-containing protein [Desulfobacterales bacterium]|jgi:signal transduction histidine kinase